MHIAPQVCQMNLIFRMLYVFVLSQFREPLGIGKPVSGTGIASNAGHSR